MPAWRHGALNVEAKESRIIWGDPVYYKGLIQDIDEGRVHFGDCCITGDDLEWHCNECGAEY